MRELNQHKYFVKESPLTSISNMCVNLSLWHKREILKIPTYPFQFGHVGHGINSGPPEGVLL